MLGVDDVESPNERWSSHTERWELEGRHSFLVAVDTTASPNALESIGLSLTSGATKTWGNAEISA